MFSLQDVKANSEKFRGNNSNSSIVAEYTIEQLKQEAGTSKLEVIPATSTHKCFFICGAFTGAVSKNIQSKLATGEIPQMKVILIDKPEADALGAAYQGLQLVEDKPQVNSIVL